MNWSLLIYLLLAILLFYLQNWIGSKSYSRGYIKFSFLNDKDEALFLNFMIKVFGPTVFLILIAAAIQYFKIPVDLNILIWVVYFYLFIRVLVIFLYARARIVNWFRIIIHYLAILLFASIIQKNFISSLEILLPDFQEIKNEIWLLILIFLYQVGNSHRDQPEPSTGQERGLAYLPDLIPRKRKYILRMHKKLRYKYNSLISEISENDSEFELTVYSILIYENFNRPPVLRMIENAWTTVTKRQATLGIMQVRNNSPISDIESIRQGTAALKKEYDHLLTKDRYSLFGQLIKYHCPDRKYIRQVLFISKAIIDHSDYRELRDTEFKKLYSQISNEFGLYFYY